MRGFLHGLLFLFCGTVACLGWSAGSVSLLAAEEKAHPEPAAHGAAHDEHGGDHGGGKMSPITKTKDDVDLAIWSLIVFGVFMFVLGKFAWKPLVAGLDKREQGVLQNIADAENARIKAEKMLADHAEKLSKVQDEVRDILAAARSDAEKTKNEIVAAAQKEADASRQRAVADIERARDAALNELFSHLARTVTDATEQVVGRSFNDADNQRLIQEVVTGFNQRRT